MIDPASIEINRRKRRAKTDRLDAEAMVRLRRWYAGGDRKIWAVVRVPSEEQEDESDWPPGRTMRASSSTLP